MPLFQKTILEKHKRSLNPEKIDAQWKLFTAHFHDPVVQQNIRNSKEEQYQEGFVNDLFVKVLGYVKNPAPDYNFITEQKNEGDSKKADGAILIDGKVRAVVELKGCNTTDLGKVEPQAFGYKNRQPGCDYVVVSNFEKLRFYVENAVEHIEFNLFELTKKDFALLWLCLSYESIKKDLPLKLKSESLSTEDQITKDLYRDYSVFRRELFNDLLLKNSRTDKLLLFKKTQKLLDRFLFIFFAEDRLLLPVNLIKKIIAEWEQLREMRVEHSLYERFKLYFNDLNAGNPKQDIFAYNGGLFQPDEILDNLQVDDQLLHDHTHKLSTYDFESEVDVNILGHIFENSLNEIEEIENQVLKNEAENLPVQVSKTSKRKKDGVFYTPKYITKYIVENTLGKLCTEKKAALEITDEIYSTAKKRSKKRLDNLQQYRDWLLQLSICDPACGSGAFLNQALEFLIEEHRYVDELSAKYNDDPLVLSDVETSILENNLYGVDINEESVHIAKLSLWLRTAQRNRKLNDLNQNLKCGNSLIDDPEIAGKKAFDWEKEFPQVFAKGGFDVVIGNPPYLRIQGLQDYYPEMVSFYNANYSSATGNYDIYVLFMEKSIELINPKGLVSFILPHKFLISEFGEGIRKFISEKRLMDSLLHFEENLVFEVTTYTCIFTLNKEEKNHLKFKYINPKEIANPFNWEEINYKRLGAKNWNLMSEQKLAVFDKIKTQPLTAKDVFSKIFVGIQTSADKIYLIDGKKEGSFIKGFSSSLDENVEIETGLMKPLLKGQDVSRYKALENQYYVIFPYVINENGIATEMTETYIRENFPKGYDYLKKNEKELRSRERGKMDKEGWFLYIYPKSLAEFEQPKIITPEIANYPNMTFDSGIMYHNTKCYSFVLKKPSLGAYKFYLSLLNSRLLWFYLSNTGYVLRGGYFTFKTKYLYPFPLPELPSEIDGYIEKAEKMLSLNAEFQKATTKFITYFSGQYNLQKLPRKLENWHELDFRGFVKELNKAIKKAGETPLSKKDEFEWMDLFEENQQKAQALQTQIAQTDREIDAMVYALYGLTEEEIAVVEKN